MEIKTTVIVRTQFPALHCWPGCPHDEVEFLRSTHRHVFHVEARAPVSHNNRQIEFIMLKTRLEEFFRHEGWWEGDLGAMSCEMICLALLEQFPQLRAVSVFEDNENGAEVVRSD